MTESEEKPPSQSLLNFFKKIKYWSSTISAIGMIISLVYVVYSTNKNIALVSKTIEQANEQLLIQKKSVPSQFSMHYTNVNEYNEQAYIVNTGNNKLRTVTAQYKYYFINSEENVIPSEGLMHFLKSNQNIEKTLIGAGIISKATDISGLLGTSRTFDIAFLKPNKETLLDVSSSSIQNAIKIAKILNYQVFTRWKIKFNEELSNEEKVKLLYIWVRTTTDDEPQHNNQYHRQELVDVPGGIKVSKLIENYENNSKQVIFGNALPLDL